MFSSCFFAATALAFAACHSSFVLLLPSILSAFAFALAAAVATLFSLFPLHFVFRPFDDAGACVGNVRRLLLTSFLDTWPFGLQPCGQW